MRLIDADAENGKLLDFIAEHDTGIQYALEHKDMTMLEDIFFEYFEAQQTAYDVYKVMEQLKEKTELAYKRYMDCNSDTPAVIYTRRSAQYQAKREFLEIVKAGGIDE